ncbi:MAG: 3-isopropylmalate dehydratase small subunit [bacterium]|nr:MAG: 3-isopropylmalate dehydratase small subunit [bacterium]
MDKILKGLAWRFGDDVDTDAIIPARYLNTSDPRELALHCMEDADPEFVNKVSAGDMIIGGKNFGCGSSREHAPIAIKAAGVSCVIAGSFARIFYRNAFNMGLPIFESTQAAAGIEAGDEIQVDPATGVISNITKGEEYRAEPYPPFMMDLIESGGLIPYLLKEEAHG